MIYEIFFVSYIHNKIHTGNHFKFIYEIKFLTFKFVNDDAHVKVFRVIVHFARRKLHLYSYNLDLTSGL